MDSYTQKIKQFSHVFKKNIEDILRADATVDIGRDNR